MNSKIDAKMQQEILDLLMKVQAYVENLEIKKSCHSCAHFADKIQGCEKYMQSPPKHIIETGCEGWEIFNTLPF